MLEQKTKFKTEELKNIKGYRSDSNASVFFWHLIDISIFFVLHNSRF